MPATQNQDKPNEYYVPPAPQPGQAGHDPYDFFMNAGQPPKKSLLPGGGTSVLSKVLVVLGLLAILAIAAALLFSIVNSGKDKGTSIINVVNDQQELLRLTSSTNKAKIDSVGLKNFAVTTEATLTTAQKDLIAYLDEQGININAKKLAAVVNTKSDTALTTAQSASVFDSTYTTIVKAELTTYQADLQEAFKATPTSSGKKLLSQQYEAAKLLMTLLTQPE